MRANQGFLPLKRGLTGLVGVFVAILVTSCASAQLGPVVDSTPTLMPTKVSLHRNATPTFVPSSTPDEEAALDSPTPSSPVLTPTSTRLNQSVPISPVPTLEPTAASRHRATMTPSTPTPEPAPVATDSPEAELIDLINQERISYGFAALTMDPRLMAAAQAHSQDMARHNFFDHIGSDGSNPGDRITRQGYQWMFFAENLACEYFTADEVVQAWLDSPGHRANMLAPEPEDIGVGIGDEPGADCNPYWTAVFAASG